MISVTVRVHPGASRDAIAVLDDGTLDVRLRARPVEGKANEALVDVLAEPLGLRTRQVRIVRGARARQKRVEIDLDSHDELRARLGAAR